MIPYAVNDIIKPAELEKVKLGGYPGKKAMTFFERRILSDHGKNDVFREAETAFVERVDDITGVGYWRGEFWGKLAISAVRVCRYLGDEALKEFIRGSARRVMATQDADGYIGTYKNADFVQSPDPEETLKIVGWRSNWCWNIWCRKYTLWGLMECYGLLGDSDILEAARRLADHLIAQLERLGLEIRQTGTFNGLPSGSIIKPMLLLYRTTGDKKYLDFCVGIAENWDRDDGAIPNLIANARSGRPIHEWYPNSEKWAKAYEMMSCLDGLVELYRVTGVEKYLDTVKRIQKLLVENELNMLFSVGYNDIFAHASSQQNAITEPCDVIHWMRVNGELFRLTGDIQYMELFEAAYLNPFLAASFRDGDWGARCVRSSGRQMIAHQCTFVHNHCCVDNMPRGYMNAAENTVMSCVDGIYINMYAEHVAEVALPDGASAKVCIGSGYADGRLGITIESASENTHTLHMRIPGWSKVSKVSANGIVYEPEAGKYLDIELLPGKNAINAEFDAAVRLIEFSGEVEQPEEGDWRIRRWCNHHDDPFHALGAVPAEYMTWQKRRCAMKGPLLLAKSVRVGGTDASMFGEEPIGADESISLEPVQAEGVWRAYAAKAGDRSFTLCDYASAADEITEIPGYFTIWL